VTLLPSQSHSLAKPGNTIGDELAAHTAASDLFASLDQDIGWMLQTLKKFGDEIEDQIDDTIRQSIVSVRCI